MMTLKSLFLAAVFFLSGFFMPACGDVVSSEAAHEAGIYTEQLAFEREERLRSHMARAENFLKENEFDLAVQEYESILKIVPGHDGASAGLEAVESARLRYERSLKEKARREQARLEREQRMEQVRLEMEMEKELDLAREQDRRSERTSRLDDRRRSRSREERVEAHLRDGLSYFRQEKFVEAVDEWNQVLELTDRTDPANYRARGWIQSARRMDMIKREIATRHSREQAAAGVPMRVLETWTYKPAQERWEEVRDEAPEEVITPARMRLMERAEQNVSVDFQRRHIRDVLRELSRTSGINIVLDDSVFPPEPEEEPAVAAPEPLTAPPGFFENGMVFDGQPPGVEPAPVAEVRELVANPFVTIKLRNIPLVEALDVILRTKGLNFRIEDHLIWITAEDKLAVEGDLVTRTYRPTGGLRNIVNMLREIIPFQHLPGAVAEDGAGEGAATVTVAPATDGAAVIPGSRLSVDRITGTIIITHSEFYHRLADDIIRRLSELIPQVTIEAKFIDISTDVLREIGINLENLEQFTDVISDDVLNIRTMPALSPMARDRGIFMRYQKFTGTQFDIVMQAFEQEGSANLLSAPRVTVLNNQEANIEVGQYVPYISSYSIRDTTVERTLPNGETVTLTQSVLVPDATAERRVGVYLRVVPGIGADRKRINLILMPEVTDFIGYEEYGIPPAVVRSPIFSTRYLHTSVDINDGETIVLGGLITGASSESLSTVPVLGDIPVLGSLFKRRSMSDSKRELLIFVTARIIEPTGIPLLMD